MERLEAVNLSKRFGGTVALADAQVEIRAGEVHTLMGENGAGKSTLARIIAGIVPADGGQYLIDGEHLEFGGPLSAQRRGIALIHQELDLFPHLTVAENIVIANLRFGDRGFTSRAAMSEFCQPFLSQLGLAVDPDRLVESLPIAEQQLVAIARALSMDCEILLMDEPTSSLSTEAVDRLFDTIRSLKSRGVAVVYVSHKMDEIFRLSDRITVLRDGKTVATLDARCTTSDELIRLMVGRSLDLSQRGARHERGQVLLEVEGLTTSWLRDVSFASCRGEVMGIAGLVGAGRSELGAALVGIEPVRGGSIRLEGELFNPSGPADAQRHGVVLLPEDRKLQGLMLNMSVQENAAMAMMPRFGRSGFISRVRESAQLRPLAERLALKYASPDVRVASLSGGNQQKVLLARWLMTEPALIFLDDPTRGIDVGAKQDIYEIIDELAAQGKSVLLASSELPELLRCCDRILVLCEGRVTAVFDAEGLAQEEIMRAATRPTTAAA